MREINQGPHLGAKLFDLRGSLDTLEGIIVQANPVYDHYLQQHSQEIALELYRIDQKLQNILKGLRDAVTVPVPVGSTDEGVPPQFC